MAHEPCRRPHHPHHACCADASRGSAAHTRGEKCAMPVRLHAERRLLHAHVSSCPCSRPEGREMPARIRTERQLLLRSPCALTQVATAAGNEPSGVGSGSRAFETVEARAHTPATEEARIASRTGQADNVRFWHNADLPRRVPFCPLL